MDNRHANMQSAKWSKATSQVASTSSKSQKAKGKERAVETDVKRPPSQLKQGWALVPLVLNGNDNSDVDKKRSRSPTKRQSIDATPKPKSRRTDKAATPKRSIAIEIVSDTDDDEIQEISFASSSKVSTVLSNKAAKGNALAAKVKNEVMELDVVSSKPSIKKPTPAVSVPPPYIMETFDLADDDDEEEEEDLEVFRRMHSPSGFANENEVLEDVDDWGDAERTWQRSRTGSTDGSTYAEEYGEESGDILERSGDSDEDILEVSLGTQLYALRHHLTDP